MGAQADRGGLQRAAAPPPAAAAAAKAHRSSAIGPGVASILLP